jgi:hypothetical protein
MVIVKSRAKVQSKKLLIVSNYSTRAVVAGGD